MSGHIRTETGEAQVFSPAGFLPGKSSRESLVSPSFLRNHPQRGLCMARKPQQKGLLLAFLAVSRRTIQCLHRSRPSPAQSTHYTGPREHHVFHHWDRFGPPISSLLKMKPRTSNRFTLNINARWFHHAIKDFQVNVWKEIKRQWGHSTCYGLMGCKMAP